MVGVGGNGLSSNSVCIANGLIDNAYKETWIKKSQTLIKRDKS